MAKVILITGSSGMLGKDIVRVLKSNNYHEIYGLSRTPCNFLSQENQFMGDLQDEKFLKNTLNSLCPEIIIHCAGLTSVDLCEEDHRLADNIHVKATKIMCDFCSNKRKFIYISTDSVFDGKNGNYSEDNNPNPINYYAASKLKGENEALKNPDSLVLRTNIYGFHLNNGTSLAEWGLVNLNKGTIIKGFTDVFFNPLYTVQVAKIINRILNENNLAGILHLGCISSVSKYDFLVNLAGTFGLNTDLIKKNSLDDINFKAPRPKNTTLNVEKLKKLFNLTLHLQDGLNELKKDFLKYEQNKIR